MFMAYISFFCMEILQLFLALSVHFRQQVSAAIFMDKMAWYACKGYKHAILLCLILKVCCQSWAETTAI